jgi:hypothetical protein
MSEEHPPEEEPPDEHDEKERDEFLGSMRAVIAYVCKVRFGAVPAEVATALAEERDLGRLARWYIAAGTHTADDLSALVRAPGPS